MKIMSSLSNAGLITLTVLTHTLFSACGFPEQEQKNSESEFTIIGGRAVGQNTTDARRLSTVALTTDHKSPRRNDDRHMLGLGRSFCTATIISERALMTAAHCLQEFDQRTNAKHSSLILPSAEDFIAYFGSKVGDNGSWLRAAKVIPHPEWNPELTLQGLSDTPPHDIGLVILNSDVPEDYTPVKIADESLRLRENQPVTLVGYGVTRSRNNNNTGLLREVQVPLKNIDAKSLLLGVGAFLKGACSGDSGGPMYAQNEHGEWFVIGVTSVGIEIFQNCIGLENYYTDARAHKRWIRSELERNGLSLL